MAKASSSSPAPLLADRVVVITGGGSGIGKAAALQCSARHARVAVLDLDGEAARRVSQEALQHGAAATIGVPCDVRDEAEVVQAVATVKENLGPPFGLVASAGIDIGGLVHELPLDSWNEVLATNLDGVYLACKYVIGAMLAAKQAGSIVLVSSPAAFVSFAAGKAGAYSASKGGVSALMRCLAIDYAPSGIRVNAVVPGPTETPLMWANIPEAERAKVRAKISSEVPLGRLADPNEIARAITWLLTDEASYVTGSHLVCDGGELAKASISV